MNCFHPSQNADRDNQSVDQPVRSAGFCPTGPDLSCTMVQLSIPTWEISTRVDYAESPAITLLILHDSKSSYIKHIQEAFSRLREAAFDTTLHEAERTV
ncbi:predicted protein [Sclerotinia sclerotiorum 1980 UF-70]|uniref:Uncharacterized protein n=1 Tax=Sclerotinia sclerotiorum (strain ATCC 18683 / 1980 / Ss-1) TaxID=665079 RepID=A7EX91_SCLS1|nr:predicted protein [Sclerotinia sclerotiorum 1980 UF-70]EDN94083.1 predicted protein [Sclerotinia sclerotiorum 1980 UF-70]